MKMFLCSILLLTSYRIILIDDRNTAFCNVIRRNQFDNSFVGGRGGDHYIIYTNSIKSPIPKIFNWENGENMSQNQTNMMFAENC